MAEELLSISPIDLFIIITNSYLTPPEYPFTWQALTGSFKTLMVNMVSASYF